MLYRLIDHMWHVKTVMQLKRLVFGQFIHFFRFSNGIGITGLHRLYMQMRSCWILCKKINKTRIYQPICIVYWAYWVSGSLHQRDK